MKKKSVLNFTLIIAVLFAMLLQSVHSFEHISKLFSEKKCPHKYTGKTEISHQHHPFDHCFVCEFTFGNFVPTTFYVYKSIEKQNPIPYFSLDSNEIYLQFKGSLFALRAPPIV